MTIRTATHAGSWYEGSKLRLSKQLDRLLSAVGTAHPEYPLAGARVLVGPHAGYAYAGPTLAETYKVWDTSKVKRVFIMGPSHYMYFKGFMITGFSEFETPLGNIPVDVDCIEKLKTSGLFGTFPSDADEEEHGIEMHLPFLYKATEASENGVPKIVPIVVGSCSKSDEKKLGKVLAEYFKDEENSFIVSTDFCHWGKRFSYRAYTEMEDASVIAELGQGYKLSPDSTPIYKSIEYLDRKGMAVLSAGSTKAWNDYIEDTDNTICGRKPLSVLLHTIENLSDTRMVQNGFTDTAQRSSWGKLQWIGYVQSSKAKTISDSSVSYASGYAIA